MTAGRVGKGDGLGDRGLPDILIRSRAEHDACSREYTLGVASLRSREPAGTPATDQLAAFVRAQRADWTAVQPFHALEVAADEAHMDQRPRA